MKFRLIFLIFVIMSMLSGIAFAGPPAQTNVVRYGDTVQGTINAEVPFVNYSFTGQQGDQVEVSVTSDGVLDPYVTLTTGTGTLLGVDDNGGGGTDALLAAELPENGTYSITVSRSPDAAEDVTGEFSLTISAEPANTIPPSSSDPSATTSTILTEARLQNIRAGSTIEGTFTESGSVNVYWFEGSAGQEITLQPDITADITPLLALYQSDLTEIVRAQPGEPLNATLDANGFYFVAAASLEQATVGRYGFEFIAPTAPSASLEEDVLLYGQTRSSSISNTNPLRRYRFQAEAGDVITARMTATEGDLDAYLLLVDSGGVPVAEDDNSAGGTNALIDSFSIPTSGEYFLIATRLGQETGFTSGSFDLALESTAPARVPSENTPRVPTDYVGLPQIGYGETVSGTISNDVFVNIYVFYGEAGETITARMEAEDSSLDPLLILLDANRIPLAENDDIEANVVRDSQIEFTLEDTGYYALVATRFEQGSGTSSGDYQLSLTTEGISLVDPDASLAEQLDAIELTPSETPSSNFQPLRLGTFYIFQAASGNLIDFSVTSDDGQQASLILANDSLQSVAASDNSVLLAVTAPTTGEYYVLVMPQGGPAQNITGSYFVALNVEVNDNTAGAAPAQIAYGNTVSARITDDISQYSYSFTGQAGDIIDIEMTGDGGLDPLLRLFGPNDELIAQNDDIEAGVIRDSRIQTTLETTGIYTIVATRYDGNDVTPTTGDFSLLLSVQDPELVGVSQEAEEIAYGDTVRGTIDETAFIRFYYFVGRQGDEITIEVNTTEGNLDAILYLYAYTSNNEPFLLTANDDSPRGGTYDPLIEYTLPRSGPYLIGLTRFADEETEPTSGSFNLTVELLETTGAQSE